MSGMSVGLGFISYTPIVVFHYSAMHGEALHTFFNAPLLLFLSHVNVQQRRKSTQRSGNLQL